MSTKKQPTNQPTNKTNQTNNLSHKPTIRCWTTFSIMDNEQKVRKFCRLNRLNCRLSAWLKRYVDHYISVGYTTKTLVQHANVPNIFGDGI